MNLYLISQEENNGYDTYDSAVVSAESEEIARLIHPSGKMYGIGKGWAGTFDSWAKSPEGVKVMLIGKTNEQTQDGVICASFNAG